MISGCVPVTRRAHSNALWLRSRVSDLLFDGLTDHSRHRDTSLGSADAKLVEKFIRKGKGGACHDIMIAGMTSHPKQLSQFKH